MRLGEPLHWLGLERVLKMLTLVLSPSSQPSLEPTHSTYHFLGTTTDALDSRQRKVRGLAADVPRKVRMCEGRGANLTTEPGCRVVTLAVEASMGRGGSLGMERCHSPLKMGYC